MRRFILDLDDTIGETFLLQGNPENIPHIKHVKGAIKFLKRYKHYSILLTAGVEAEQQQKIDVLGIRRLFREIIIVPRPQDKLRELERIVARIKVRAGGYFYNSHDVVIVGDRLDVEICKGNELGCRTVRMKIEGGSHSGMMPRGALNEIPHHTVCDFMELLKIFPY